MSIDKVIAVIPAYQPGPVLLTLLNELKMEGIQSVIIDDGSGPEYEKIFREAEKQAVVLHHEKNAGKGAALKTGFRYLQENQNGMYVVVTVDADGQHLAQDVFRTAWTAVQHEGVLVLGCRKFVGKVPLRSRFGNKLTRKIFRTVTGTEVSDTQTGLRAFDSRLLSAFLETEGSRYEYEINMLLGCAASGIPMQEIEIETIYEKNNSSSHFHALRDSLRIYREILRYACGKRKTWMIGKEKGAGHACQ